MFCLRDASEQWEYFMPFDINERDATGQNILYVASLLGNKKLVEVILKFKIKATRIIQSGSSVSELINFYFILYCGCLWPSSSS